MCMRVHQSTCHPLAVVPSRLIQKVRVLKRQGSHPLQHASSTCLHPTKTAWHMQAPSAVPAQESSQTAAVSQDVPAIVGTSTSTAQPAQEPAQGPDTGMQQPAPVSRWARLQQNMNVAGVALFLRILGGDQRLAVPHLTVPDIRSVDWAAIRKAGFRAVVFDKDNTLTLPFEMKVESHLEESLSRCKAAFGAANITLYSNSAGLEQYDPEGHEATALESALGINVMRHKQKKPAGDAGEVAQHFGCQAHELVMVGDRYLTDVVFGNRHGMLTIRPTPLNTQGEPKGVLVARQVEEYFVGRWTNAGVRAPDHPLAPQDVLQKFALQPAAPPSTPAS